MVARLITFGLIALVGLGCFVAAVVFLMTKSSNAELIILSLAPAAGICSAIVMHYANIDFSMNISLVVKDGNLQLEFKQN